MKIINKVNISEIMEKISLLNLIKFKIIHNPIN